MNQLLKITIQLGYWSDNENSLQLSVAERVRTAKPREIAALQLGSNVREEDIELTMQLIEDTIRSAVGRTLGITQSLPL